MIIFCSWFQKELPSSIESRTDGLYLTQPELVKLMEWKLERGKFRPRLVQLAASNSEDFVKSCTKEGLEVAKKDLPKGLDVLCKILFFALMNIIILFFFLLKSVT